MEKLIMCFGDSLTYGYCADPGKDYVSLFKAKVSEDFPNSKIIIRNRGENGESTRGALKRIDNELESYSPCLVIMLFGSNDSAYSLWYHVGLDEFSRNYDILISKILKSDSKLVLITPTPVVEDSEIPFIDNDVLDKYCSIIKEKAIKYGLPLVDMNKAFLDAGDLPSLLQWDGLHISTKGYQLFFDTLYRTLKNIIQFL
ncbi:hypothetical protein IMSAG049_00495 [Clostridiales bacterium]|nr:hypothetical protein IMSAG049_00495 [Clostridiales bacterium]